MTCPKCGGRMHGDGFTVVCACENVDTYGMEPDAGPVLCDFEEGPREVPIAGYGLADSPDRKGGVIIEPPKEAKPEPAKRPEFIAFDYAGAMQNRGRYTHIPTGATLVCQPWMGQDDWDKAMLEFLKKYGPDIVIWEQTRDGRYQPEGHRMGSVAECIANIEKRQTRA